MGPSLQVDSRGPRMFSCLIICALLAPGVSCGEDGSLMCGEPEPSLTMPRAPYRPLVFTRVDGRKREALSIRYSQPGAVSFEFRMTGRCNREEQGVATLKPCWWLGAETDENEAGEAVFVQEYVFRKNKDCSMFLRIEEGEWKQATISESKGCSKGCPASGDLMRLRKP